MYNRLLLCLLICGVLLYYGVPQLSIGAEGLEGIFAFAWLVFALIVISGNLIGLLYRPKGSKKSLSQMTNQRKRLKLRQYQ
ncbi:hypothetical protein [Fredinandcohnia quinoae]|uniref:Uncharacterized protein n=1 Tax=Fredinandcohnia quinoae TaxID=2918902 RepID=A0AAW5EFI6_9BACI|nr:hypothetical protein [Fredinandcohnia sp. SECRCQ15]MCH1627978.1 hypothetical protein [Fredinandcohnia sp. SECRCQ15]